MKTVEKKSNVIGVNIKKLRMEKKITQTELAEKIGVKRSTVAAWETGKRSPDFENIGAVARFFGVPVDYLYGRCGHRYKINVPDYFEFDLSKLNSKGVTMLYEQYKLLLNSDDYSK